MSAAPLLQCKPSWVTCSVDGNNEVSVWNLETGACEKSLWASHAPPLSQTQVGSKEEYTSTRTARCKATDKIVVSNNLLGLFRLGKAWFTHMPATCLRQCPW